MQACYLLVSTRMLWRSFLHGHMMSLLSPYLRWMLVIVTGTLLVFLHNAVCQIRKQGLNTSGVFLLVYISSFIRLIAFDTVLT